MEGRQKKRVTRKDVAKRAGVSETIVSYVMNGNRYVREDKRQRVLEAVEELNYRPNHLARSLKMQESRHLLFLTDDLRSEHFGELLDHMEKLLFEEGYLISLSRYREDKAFVNDIIARQFDGIFLSSSGVGEKTLARLGQAGIPLVMIRRNTVGRLPKRLGVLNSGLYEGERQVLGHLYGRGNRELYFVCSPNASCRADEPETLDPRALAYLDFCGNKGLRPRFIAGRDKASLEAAIRKSLAAGTGPMAVAALNDDTAAAVLDAAADLGLKVPEEVSVAGFDNTVLSRHTVPALSTVSVDRLEMAEKLTFMMKRLLRGEVPEEECLEASLIIRKSS